MKTIKIDGVEYNLTPIEKQSNPIILEQHLKFEVYPKDLGKHNWEDAKKVCEDLGDGWRLPSKKELYVMWLNKKSVGCFVADYYWSSSMSDTNFAWVQHFATGSQFNNDKNFTYYVRAVRTLSI